MIRLVLATRNTDKIREFREALGGNAVELASFADYPGAGIVEEDGDSLEANAMKKARALSAHAGCAAVADDTGLFVKALGGRPGVNSSRYSGPEGSYTENVTKLLREMEKVPDLERTAYFRTVIAVSGKDEGDVWVSGEVHGVIAREPRGSGGFGYDPVFIPEGKTLTFAEMSLEEKNTVSHRGNAIRRFKEWLSRKSAG